MFLFWPYLPLRFLCLSHPIILFFNCFFPHPRYISVITVIGVCDSLILVSLSSVLFAFYFCLSKPLVFCFSFYPFDVKILIIFLGFENWGYLVWPNVLWLIGKCPAIGLYVGLLALELTENKFQISKRWQNLLFLSYMLIKFV